MTERNSNLPAIQAEEQKMGLPPLWIGSLDLNNLPDRLDDKTYLEVQEIANAPLADLPPCGEKHLKQALRFMLAVLPKRSSDDISGELFVAAYNQKLGHYPAEQISFLADQAMERCKWFPTIAECMEIMGEWRRRDIAVIAKRRASDLSNAERRAREEDARHIAIRDEIASKDWRSNFRGLVFWPEWLQNYAVEAGYAIRTENGLERNDAWCTFSHDDDGISDEKDISV